MIASFPTTETVRNVVLVQSRGSQIKVLSSLGDARQYLRGCEMAIQSFVLHFCAVMLSAPCANCSAQSVSNYSMPAAWSSIHPKMMLIPPKKVST